MPNRMKFYKFGFYILLALLITCVFLIVRQGSSDMPKSQPKTGTYHPAFLNSTWEMSIQEVMQVNPGPLDSASRFSIGFDDGIPRVADISRYTVLKSADIFLWSDYAEVFYTFFDNKLMYYSVWLEDSNPRKLDSIFTTWLSKKYGPPLPQSPDLGMSKALSWETPIATFKYVRGKKHQESLSFDMYFGGVRALYKPLVDELRTIQADEAAKVF